MSYDMPITFTVTNAGTQTAHSITNSWPDYIYVSTDAILAQETRPIEGVTRTGDTVTRPVIHGVRTVVVSKSPGTYYVIVRTDDNTGNPALVPAGQVLREQRGQTT
jgi:hypothetical protein